MEIPRSELKDMHDVVCVVTGANSGLGKAAAAERSIVYLAASPEVEGATGQHCKETEIVNPSPEANDEKVEARVWKISREMTGLTETSGEARL
jgi:NAD(P)-dependent dehydrogenase (short-subunit alcohol dehydrogenase family)